MWEEEENKEGGVSLRFENGNGGAYQLHGDKTRFSYVWVGKGGILFNFLSFLKKLKGEKTKSGFMILMTQYGMVCMV